MRLTRHAGITIQDLADACARGDVTLTHPQPKDDPYTPIHRGADVFAQARKELGFPPQPVVPRAKGYSEKVSP